MARTTKEIIEARNKRDAAMAAVGDGTWFAVETWDNDSRGYVELPGVYESESAARAAGYPEGRGQLLDVGSRLVCRTKHLGEWTTRRTLGRK